MKATLSGPLGANPGSGFGERVFERLQGPLHRPAARAVTALQVKALVEECCRARGQPGPLLRSWALTGVDWEDIYLHGVVPAAQQLGALWLADRLDFAMVSIASTLLQQALYDLSPTFLGCSNERSHGLSALLVCSPESQHTMGHFMLGEFFRKHGWRVHSMPCLVAASALRNVQADWFDVVGLSLSTNQCLETMGSLIPALRQASANTDIKVMVGGPMVEINRGLVLSLGADFIGADARESERLARQYARNDPRRMAEYGRGAITMDTSTRMHAFTLDAPDASKP